jgi:hypothetical protein
MRQTVIYKPLDRDLAYKSHAFTSFYPEKRAEQRIQDHKNMFDELVSDLGGFFEQKHADKLHSLWTDYLHAHSRVASTMITSPANFPVERNRKYSDWADNKFNAICEYRDNLHKWKRKADKRQAIEGAGGELAMAKSKLEQSQKRHEAMKSANRIIRKATKNGGITTETTSEVESLGFSHKEASAVTFPPERLRMYGTGFASFELTNSNARIKNQIARVAELERREAAKESNDASETVEIPGGVIIYDTPSNRINVKHEEKPAREVIDTIKKHGFRWSRRFSTWTRQMTPNAKSSARQLFFALTN